MLDENVRLELTELLTARGVNFKTAKKSSVDKALAKISLAEKRVVVTNDSDFSEMRRGDVFGVVWLRLPQNNPSILLEKFEKLLDDKIECVDSLVILEPEKRRVTPLPVRIRLS
ncbi:MAG: DUF5615 family PIN-like protein [bacterium]|nr:DUF5615 family PIN-like protein [bacterium]